MNTMNAPKRLRQWAGYVEEAHLAGRVWRAQSWRDEEMYDGDQASPEDIAKFKEIGVELLTINRTFPAVNLILGSQAINKTQITAKARTGKDSEISQTMSEAIQYVIDCNNGDLNISLAFKNQVVPGIGNLFVGRNRDPRYETVKVAYRDWKECHSDPFVSPWADAGQCRYKFWEKWVDLDALQAAYTKKKSELEDLYLTLTEMVRDGNAYTTDEAELVEEMKQIAVGVPWVDIGRRRVRPVEIWYTKPKDCLFVMMQDGCWYELEDDMDPRQQHELLVNCIQFTRVTVPKMYNAVFCSSVILKDESPSDLGHDLYPNVPFVGYVDRWGFPYGVPRQIRGQDEEVNKRRSMALALMRSRRTIAEDDIAKDKKGFDNLHKELNAIDGMAIVKKGSISSGKIQVKENTELSNAQFAIMAQSEREIQEISGANGEAMGYQTNVTAKVGLENKQQRSGIMTATLLNNYRFALKALGLRISAGIQKTWTGPKILRVTDRLTSRDKFIEINKVVDGVVQNHISKGQFDMIVTDVPKSDTIREKNLNLIIEWVKKSPPEFIPHLMNMAFEMTDLPNKDQFLEKIKPLMGYDPMEEDMTADERKQKIIEQLEAEKQIQAKKAQLEDENIQLEINKKRLENAKIEAEINKILADTNKINIDTQDKASESGRKAEKHEMDRANFVLDTTAKGLDVGEKIVGRESENGE
ncbi:hypothetical protein [Desulfospira joergensenii]|uniref:portal protein n=1 Tax=Desulfospira joergensenii TaxID=53329 RepID=UPI0003B36202|nr:hypothetical protein [Desulfospira joergensenii]